MDASLERLNELYNSACQLSEERRKEIERLKERIRSLELANASVDQVYAKLLEQNERLIKTISLACKALSRLDEEAARARESGKG